MNVKTNTQTEYAYETLRRDIIEGRLEADMKLKVVALKERYDIGAAPLREALSRLVSDQLVLQHNRRGFHVAPATYEDALDVTNARIVLERELIRLSLEHGDDEWEGNLLAAYHRLHKLEQRLEAGEGHIDELEAFNFQFHKAVLNAAPSTWLMSMWQKTYMHHERYRNISRSTSVGKRNLMKEHKDILDAVLSRDIAETIKQCEKHITITKTFVASQMDVEI